MDHVDQISHKVLIKRENGVGWISEATLSAEESADEMLIMGLRVEEGAALAAVEQRRGRPLNADALAWLQENGLLVLNDGRMSLTRAGRLVANQIAAELVT